MAKQIKWEFFDILDASLKTINSEGGPVIVEQHSIHDTLEHWIANCNFPITRRIVDKLDLIDGIDVLYVLSKHRFMIAIGKLFTIDTIKVAIDKAICNKDDREIELSKLDNARVKLEIEELSQSLKKDYKYWSIYVYPDGKIDFCASNKLDDTFLSKYECFNSFHKYSKGVLINGEENYKG